MNKYCFPRGQGLALFPLSLMIATPDHWHSLIAAAAAEAGEDLYCEKPMGISLEDGQAIRTAVRQNKRVFQAGTWQRSVRNFRYACELARNGYLGKIHPVEVATDGTIVHRWLQGPARSPACAERACGFRLGDVARPGPAPSLSPSPRREVTRPQCRRWNDRTVKSGLNLSLALASSLCAQSLLLAAAPAPTVVEEFNRPFLFSYLAWQNKAHTSNGLAVLRGFNNQGGAGLNGEWNLVDQAALIPALKLEVGPSNKAAALVLMLKDAGQGEGRWEFPLPAAAAGFTTVVPRDGDSLAEPNAIGKDGRPDLAKLRQLQLIGDWAEVRTVQVEVDAVLLLPATDAVLAARAARE